MNQKTKFIFPLENNKILANWLLIFLMKINDNKFYLKLII